jgi:type IV pilus assembly protein PilN
MRFTINLATRTYLDHRLVNQALIALTVVMLAWLAWNASRLWSDLGELGRLGREAAVLEERLNSRPSGVSEDDYKRLMTSIGFYNGIIERKSYDWLGLLEQLEQATPAGVSLASVAAETGAGEIKLEGRARSFTQVRTYLEKLEDSKAFTDILLRSHRELALGEKTRGVQFSVDCRAVTP